MDIRSCRDQSWPSTDHPLSQRGPVGNFSVTVDTLARTSGRMATKQGSGRNRVKTLVSDTDNSAGN